MKHPHHFRLQGIPSHVPMNMGAIAALLATIFAAYGAIQHFYFGGAFLDAISYVSDERPLNSIIAGLLGQEPSATAVGIHAFGDFLQPHYWVTLTNPWLEDGTNMINYLPAVLVAHEVLSIFPYRVAFGIYQAAMALCLAIPMWWASKGLPWAHRVLLVLVLGLLSGPAIASLDRGNTQGFVPICMFGASIAILSTHWARATLFLIAAGTLKLYPLVMVFVLISLRRYRWAILAFLGTALLALALLPLVSENLWPSLSLVFLNPLEYGDRTFFEFMNYNVSFAGGLAHGAYWLGSEEVAKAVAENTLWTSALAALITLPLIWISRLALWVRIILSMLMTSSVMPVIYPYAMNWVIAATALTVGVAVRKRLSEGDSGSQTPPWQWWPVVVSLILLSVPYPFFIPGSMEAGIPASALGLMSAFVSVALPASLWIGLVKSRKSCGST